jgi:hypothetical protein
MLSVRIRLTSCQTSGWCEPGANRHEGRRQRPGALDLLADLDVGLEIIDALSRGLCEQLGQIG